MSNIGPNFSLYLFSSNLLLAASACNPRQSSLAALYLDITLIKIDMTTTPHASAYYYCCQYHYHFGKIDGLVLLIYFQWMGTCQNPIMLFNLFMDSLPFKVSQVFLLGS